MNQSCMRCGADYSTKYRGWYQPYVLKVCSPKCFRQEVLSADSFEISTRDTEFERVDGKISDRSFRSNYEQKFVEALRTQKILWDYEPFSVTMPDGSRYMPDFIIGKKKAYTYFVEVKGFWTSEAKKKFLNFVSLFPQYPIIVADLEFISMINRREK